MAPSHPLHRLFEPKHVALLGVSRDTSKAGYKFLRSLLDAGYQGKISLLGGQAGELEGLQIHTSPAAGISAETPSTTRTAREFSRTVIGFNPSAVAISVISPAFGTDRRITRFTPPSTGSVFDKI